MPVGRKKLINNEAADFLTPAASINHKQIMNWITNIQPFGNTTKMQSVNTDYLWFIDNHMQHVAADDLNLQHVFDRATHLLKCTHTAQCMKLLIVKSVYSEVPHAPANIQTKFFKAAWPIIKTNGTSADIKEFHNLVLKLTSKFLTTKL